MSPPNILLDAPTGVLFHAHSDIKFAQAFYNFNIASRLPIEAQDRTPLAHLVYACLRVIAMRAPARSLTAPSWEEMKDHEIKRLKQKIGDLVMNIDILKEPQRGHPTARQMPDE